MDDLLGTAEVARLLDVDPETVRGWLKRKILPCIKYPCGYSRIRRGDLQNFVLPRRGPKLGSKYRKD